MRIGSVSHSLLMLIAGGTASVILAAGSARAAPRAQADLVEFEKMTWVEVKSAIAAGKTTALIYTGGVEERGPQNANGGHNLIAHATVEVIGATPFEDSDLATAELRAALRSRWRPAGGLRGGRQQAQRTLRSSACVLL